VKLLLDTCTFLWIAGGGRALPPAIAAAYQSQDNKVYLSAASIWEIAIKYSQGRLPLPVPPHTLVAEERSRRGLTSLAIDEESALHIAKLPPLHGDPFDRLLVSQAIVHGMTILTPDPILARYPARTLW
jgi:PIN domain nuclease of toxin-antitoxin system